MFATGSIRKSSDCKETVAAEKVLNLVRVHRICGAVQRGRNLVEPNKPRAAASLKEQLLKLQIDLASSNSTHAHEMGRFNTGSSFGCPAHRRSTTWERSPKPRRLYRDVNDNFSSQWQGHSESACQRLTSKQLVKRAQSVISNSIATW